MYWNNKSNRKEVIKMCQKLQFLSYLEHLK